MTNDLISKEEILKAFSDYVGSGMSMNDFDALWDIVAKMPPVKELKVGHWIKIEPYPLQMHDYKCSECGHETDDNTENYCSECGAKMVEQQEREEEK